MSEGWLHFCVTGGTAIACALPWLLMNAIWRHGDRRQERAAAEAKRVASGLPPHERCVCGECAAWRAVPSNITGLQS